MSNEKMREEFEAEVIKRMNESGFSEIEVRVEMLGVSKDGVYHDGTVSCWWYFWQASRATPDGYCFVPNETIKKAYALASSVCGDCYAGEDTESLLANQLTKEISKSDYWMNIK